MISAGDLYGVDIVNKHEKKVGEAVKAVYAPGEERIRGILYKPGSSLLKQLFLPVSLIAVIDRNGLIVTERKGRAGIKVNRRIEEMIEAETFVYANGKEIGRLSDIYIDAQGYIRAVEISRSFLDDLLRGRRLETEFGELAFERTIKKQKNKQKEQ